MSLTTGIGPFAHRRVGPEGARAASGVQANSDVVGPAHVLYFHPVPQRVRAVFAGEVIVDTEGAHLLHETRLRPVFYLPRSDVRFDLLEPTEHTSHCPFKGDARYWTVRVGERVAENAVWGYDSPVDGCPDLSDFVALYFDRMDRWFEEDDELIGHPRDPFHRVDVRSSSRTVVVRVDGEEVARCERPLLLFETGLPVRYYLPADAWRPGALEPSERTTICPYKGVARYETVRSPGGVVEDAVWRYDDPYDEVGAIAGLRAVDPAHDRIEIEVSPGH